MHMGDDPMGDRRGSGMELYLGGEPGQQHRERIAGWLLRLKIED